MSYHSDLSLIKMESKSFHNLDCNCYDCRIENTRRVDSSGHYIRRESNIQSHKSSTPSIRSPHLNRRMPDKSCVQCGKKSTVLYSGKYCYLCNKN